MPWPLTFSFARAIQAPALMAWMGKSTNVPAAQAKILHRAQLNRKARQGLYLPNMEESTKAELFS